MKNIDQLKNTVLAVIDQHTNISHLNEELHKEEESEADNIVSINDGSSRSFSDGYLKDYISLYAQITGSNEKQSIETILLSELHLVTSGTLCIYTDSQQLSQISFLVKELKCHSSAEEFSQKISASANNFKHCLPISVLNLLDQEGILKLPEFIKVNISHQRILKELVYALQICCMSENEEYQEEAAGLLCVLINCGYRPNHADKALLKICQYILQYIIGYLLTKLGEAAPKAKIKNKKSVFQFIQARENCDPAVLSSCYMQQIVSYVGKNPSLNVSDALDNQSNWNSFAVPTLLFQSYKDILSCAKFDQVAAAVKSAIARPEINWKSLLTFVSPVLVLYKEAAVVFEDLIAETLKKGLEETCSSNLVISFLLARHCSAEGSHIFMSYSDWFQKYFSSGPHNVVTSARSFRFLIKFLTSLVPFEPLLYIKVHVLKPPYPPSQNLRDLLREYTTLAMTRIDDLKHTVSGEREEQSLANQEVDEAIKTFANAYKIPSTVLEMSIFRKAHYFDKFLPLLLRPRPIPDVEDDKMKFISALLKTGKIPKSMYAAYQTKCSEASAKLLEDIIDLDVEFPDTEEELARFGEEVNKLLSAQVTNTTNQVFKEFGLSISRIVHLLVEDTTNKSGCAEELIDLDDKKATDDIHNQILEKLIESLEKTPRSNYHAVEFLIELLRNFPSLKEAVCRYLWNHFTNEVEKHNFVINNGCCLLLIVVSSNLQWDVTFSPSPPPNALLEPEATLKKDSSCLMEAILMTSSLRNVTMTSVLNEIKYGINIANQLRMLNLESWNERQKHNLALLHSSLNYALEKFKFCIKEKQLIDLGASHPKRIRLLNQCDDWKGIDDTLINSLQQACDFLKLKLECNEEGRQNVVLEFVKREMHINLAKDLLSTKNRKQFYKSMLFQDDIGTGALEAIAEIFLDNPWVLELSTSNWICQFICDNFLLMLQMNGCQDPGAWILEIIRRRCKKIFQSQSSCFRTRRAMVDEISIFSIFLSSVAPTLLFVHPSDSDRREWLEPETQLKNKCQHLSVLVNEYLRNYLFEACLFDVTLPHLFSGLSQGFMGRTVKKEIIEVLKRVSTGTAGRVILAAVPVEIDMLWTIWHYSFLSCLTSTIKFSPSQLASSDMLQHLPYQLPLIVAALLLQWKDIPDVQRLCQQSCPDFWGFMNYWRSVLDGDIHDGKGSCFERLSNDPPAYSFGLAFLVLRRNKDLHQTKNLLQKYSPILADSYSYCTQCLVAIVGQRMLNNTAIDMDWEQKMFDFFLSVFSWEFFEVCTSPEPSMFLMFSEKISKTYYHIAFLRLLSESSTISKIEDNGNYLPTLLSTYEKCHQEMESTDAAVQSLFSRALHEAEDEVLKAESQKYSSAEVVRELLRTELRRRQS